MALSRSQCGSKGYFRGSIYIHLLPVKCAADSRWTRNPRQRDPAFCLKDGDNNTHIEMQKTQRNSSTSSLLILFCTPSIQAVSTHECRWQMEFGPRIHRRNPGKVDVDWLAEHPHSSQGCRFRPVTGDRCGRNSELVQLVSVRLISSTAYKLPPLLRFGHTNGPGFIDFCIIPTHFVQRKDRNNP